MNKESLPEPFNHFWKMSSVPSVEPTSQKNKEKLSNEWNTFLEAIQKRIESDLKEE